MSETVTGYIDHVIFRNEDNGYTVMVLKGTKKEEELTCVGSFPAITQGASIEATGVYIHHPVYGKQFQISSFTEKMPEDTYGIERYLGSGAIRGIGAALAARIVRKFGDDTLRIVEEEPERLAEVKGISEKKAREIAAQVSEKAEMRKEMIYLQKYGISTTLAAKIYQYYGNGIYRVLEENPYQMADHISGVEFRTADEIAKRIGIHTDSDYRIRSGLFYALLQATGNGHTYLPEEELFANASALLNVEPEHMEKHLVDLQMEKKLVVKEKDGKRIIYPAQFYYMELNTARMLHDLNLHSKIDEDDVKKRLKKITEAEKIELDELQEQAVMEAVSNGLLIITGGPGTGKTTTINTIIHYFDQEDMEILLAAPTGRAAKRMTEATGYEAKTIHRLLELTGAPTVDQKNNGNSGENRLAGMHFERNEENPLDADVIIIDEMSMVDISLIHSLLKAVNVGTRLILVGDVNQLPSVGPGNVLRDMIASEAFPVVKLTKIFRQAAQSDIIVNAHKINDGEAVPLNKKSRDFLFIRRDYPADIVKDMMVLVQDKLPNYVHAEMSDIQIMTPMRKGALGVEALNKQLQEKFNPPAPNKQEKESGGTIFRVGDKVMQIRNNYQLEWEIRSRYGLAIDKGLGVFNGDVGIIQEINDYSSTVSVLYDENKLVIYPFKGLDELELAYAITIHKSQGSEYPAVVMPLLPGPRMLMNRNLLYTAVTRARKCITIVGDENVFYRMIDNTTQQRRYSGLKERLKEASLI